MQEDDLPFSFVFQKNVDLCDKWMNKCLAIFLSFNDVDGLNFDRVYDCCLCRLQRQAVMGTMWRCLT